MPRLKSYAAILQASISPEGDKWIYQLPDLPQAQQTNAAGLLKCISFKSSEQSQQLVLRCVDPPTNRVTRVEPLDRFLLMSFADFRLYWPALSPEHTPTLATNREHGDYITRLLTTGVKLNGVSYHFFGHSNSQLKSRSCFMYAATKETISSKIEALGNFSNLKSVGKKAKRIGLLFSSAEMALTLSPERCEDIEDVKRNDYIFTDGCGLIAPQLARHLAQRRNIIFRGKRYMPSVYQIRYRGYKGVLMLDSRLSGKVQVQFRESMRKFKDVPDHSFAVVDYSKPYCLGSLNDEMIVLLYTLGISRDTLLRKQKEHLQFLQNVSRGDPRAAFQFLSYCNRLDLAEKLLLDGVESVRSTLVSLVKQEFTKMLNKHEEQRCRILIPQSRLLFGVCDPFGRGEFAGKLKDGECFVRITHDGTPRTVFNTEVLVTRNPCLHPGDLQKFKAVDVPEFVNLVDCIVFPTRGKRPSADLMSGGDLDGDKFFVTWDPDVIPRTMAEPAQYPGGKELITFGEVNGDARAEYFARYTNASLGRVKNLYMKWARLGNAMSSECQQLNRLFSQCVDGNHIRIPDNLREFSKLEDPPEPSAVVDPFILDVLHTAATEFIQNATNMDLNIADPPNLLDLFLNREKLAMSEFELLQFLLRWCERHKVELMEYNHLLNFSALSDEERAWVLGRLPPSATSSSIVRNGLLQSDIVSADELRHFSLHHSNLHWKPIFKSSIDRMGRFIPTVCRALETFHKKLIFLYIDERVAFAIYVPKKIARASEVQVDSSVRIFAFPHSQGPHSLKLKVLPTKTNYRLYCDDNVFQLYERRRANTWIFLRRPHGDDSLYRNEKSKGDKRRKREQTIEDGQNFDCKVSIALDKIGRDIQRQFGKLQQQGVPHAEIYVISNRDTQSMRFLDQWLDYVDTEQVLPLFEGLEVEYNIPQLKDTDWEKYSPLVVAVVRDRNLAQLRLVNTIQDLETIFNILETNNEKTFLRDVFDQVLSFVASSATYLNSELVASMLLNYLPQATYLIPSFLQSQAWKQNKPKLEDTLVGIAPVLLRRLVLSEYELQGFIRLPFQLLLQELRRISMQDLSDLVEMIALSVRSTESAMDLLLEILDPETPRLIVGRPMAIRQYASSLFGIALDHIHEASAQRKAMQDTLKLFIEDSKDGFAIVKSRLRIDSSMSGSLSTGDHVRLTATNPPQNAPFSKKCSVDALVLNTDTGSVTFRYLQQPPSYIGECAWTLTQCGSFVTSKTTLDAVTAFYSQHSACCRIFHLLVGLPDTKPSNVVTAQSPVEQDSSLNESQNAALVASMSHPLTFIWGPPGTGKTHTVIVILSRLLKVYPESRFLVTAPTHNAVDNLLRRFIHDEKGKQSGIAPLRVSTKLAKVAVDLRTYTCDAMLGKDLSANLPARRKAQKKIQSAKLIFTTCIGAGLGLLRDESFDIVVVDEASQQTEPATLVPLVKGCSRAILVGDHVQLRATVQPTAALVGYDISLFERHYNLPARNDVAKIMLDTQYRMHRSICAFSSTEFYDNKLKTAVPDRARPLPSSMFPWPEDNRLIWIECASDEDIGRQSKANAGQVELCKRVLQLLRTAPVATPSSADSSSAAPLKTKSIPSIAILTPYTRQKEALSSAIQNVEISSIDGFQGREADIVVFVTVRCNVHCDMGFLNDMRRLNVVMTRAKVATIVIGNKNTLTGRNMAAEGIEESKQVWLRLFQKCTAIDLPATAAENGR